MDNKAKYMKEVERIIERLRVLGKEVTRQNVWNHAARNYDRAYVLDVWAKYFNDGSIWVEPTTKTKIKRILNHVGKALDLARELSGELTPQDQVAPIAETLQHLQSSFFWVSQLMNYEVNGASDDQQKAT